MKYCWIGIKQQSPTQCMCESWEYNILYKGFTSSVSRDSTIFCTKFSYSEFGNFVITFIVFDSWQYNIIHNGLAFCAERESKLLWTKVSHLVCGVIE
jgi:hypothetical protein